MDEIYRKMEYIAESLFGTQNDPEQILINEEANRKLRGIHQDTILWREDGNGNPISWIVVVPTSIPIMEKFLKREISEQKLFDIATEEKKFDALYLCSAITIPEYRKRGLAMELMLEAIEKFAPKKEQPLFSWPYSPEGDSLIRKLEEKLGRKILLREE